MEQAALVQIGVPEAERRRSRRRHSITEKLAIIGECLQPGASLAGVALAHGANANMVRKWVVKYQRGGYGAVPEAGAAMLPVMVKDEASRRTSDRSSASKPTLEIELARGVLRLQADVTPTLLRTLIEALARG